MAYTLCIWIFFCNFAPKFVVRICERMYICVCTLRNKVHEPHV